MDSSDYMIIAKSNGFIEVIRDYQHKLESDLSLKPDFVLSCIPLSNNYMLTTELSVAGLEYRDGLLYCCTCFGDLYVFVLNLPADYMQAENMFKMGPSSEEFVQDKNASGTDLHSSEESSFLLHSRFTGRTKLKHVCYYLIPADSNVRTGVQKRYGRIPCFQETIYTNLKKNISNFHINPLDKFSVVTIAPRTPLTIHKIRLPKLFVDFFVAVINLKQHVIDSKYEEVWDLNAACREIHNQSIFEYLKYDTLSSIDHDADPNLWNSLVINMGIADLNAFSVWRQKQGQLKDEIYELFHGPNNECQSKGLPSSDLEVSRERPQSRRERPQNQALRSNSLRRDILTRAIDAPYYSNTTVDKFIRSVRRNTCPVDFKIVKTRSCNTSDGDHDFTGHDGDDTMTSFLTDNYKDMDIISIDKFLVLTAFRPKYIDEPLMKVESFHNSAALFCDAENHESMLTIQRTLRNFSSFKRLFMINDSLCLIFDTHGVLLFDRFKIRNCRNLFANCPSALKAIDFNIGLINDVAVVINNLNECRNCDDCEDDKNISFEAFATCVTGEVLALHGEFYKHSRIGKMVLRDCLRINKNNKFVDQILLINFDEDFEQRKRRPSEELAWTSIKRVKR
ncbi:LAFE_0B04082g1_1 [Lachancea fermentati]|uniref:LAFE_0B04082g1_1 n=1 Tax=Lachancea fermentati TaxID=4955 RepID=A0A1G4M7Y6_LACFM|nr:LAFE_0B04082g1_1 [Lachancea fermentati]